MCFESIPDLFKLTITGRPQEPDSTQAPITQNN